MRRADAGAFLVTAFAVLFLNAVAAVALGCCVYATGVGYRRWLETRVVPDFTLSRSAE